MKTVFSFLGNITVKAQSSAVAIIHVNPTPAVLEITTPLIHYRAVTTASGYIQFLLTVRDVDCRGSGA